MNFEMKKSERIQRYLDGEMSEGEIKAFKRDLLNDPELSGELDLHRVIKDSLRKRDEFRFRKKLEDAYYNYAKNTDSQSLKRNKQKNLIIQIISAVAAIIVLGLFLIIKGNHTDNATLFNKYYSPFENAYSTRDVKQTESNSSLIRGVGLYMEGDYQLSKVYLEEYLSSWPKDSLLATFYLGLDHLELKEYVDAENCFAGVSHSSFSFYQEHSNWYLGLTYLMNDKPEAAGQIFKDLSENKSIYSKKSAQILKKISSVK